MMHIFTAVSNLYYPQIKVFARSLRKHNPEPITLCVLYSGLSPENRDDLSAYAKRLDIALRLIPADPERVEKYKLLSHITVEAYFRFMLLEIYPREDRAMWMDVDTVVLRSIAPFYHMDLSDHYVAGTPEAKEKLDKERLKLDPDGCYFNAGVVLYNLRKIREEFAPDFLYQLYEQHEASIRFADQDVLNIAFSHKARRDDTGTYNYMIRSGTPMTRQELRRIKKEVAVVHFIRHIKPWQVDYQGRIRFVYLKEMFPLYPLKTIALAIGGWLRKD